MIFLLRWIRKQNIIKSISLNAKINEITKADEMKSGYRDAINIKIKEIVTSIDMIVNNEKNEWKNDAVDDIWEKWARKTNTKRRCASSMFFDLTLFVESQYIKTSKQFDKQDLKSFRLVWSQKLLWILKQRRLLLISKQF